MLSLQKGWSPLYTASLNGHIDVVETLIEAGANVNQADKVGPVYMQACTYTYDFSVVTTMGLIQFCISAGVK